jgi:hypothetical protein
LVAERYHERPHILKFVYIKTGNESISSLKLIENKEGYAVIDRESVLQILNTRQIDNDIFNDFRSYLTELQMLTASCTSFATVNSNANAAQGFYLKLQRLITEWTDWDYVSNPTGGFWGFWYHWVTTADFELYIQIENRIGVNLQVTIKIGTWRQNMGTLNRMCSELQEQAPKYELQVVRPRKYRLGKTSTLAIVGNAIPVTFDGEIDILQLLTNLQNLQQMLDDYVSAAYLLYPFNRKHL